jgi:c-di-GMP-binding flagellar brake protein YcgR
MEKSHFERERRQFLRAGTYHLLRYVRYGSHTAFRPILSVSRNISGGGLMFIAEEKLEVGDKVEIELNFPPFGSPIKATAQVKHVRKKEKSHKWFVGAKFVELDNPAQRRILDYVDYINKALSQDKNK